MRVALRMTSPWVQSYEFVTKNAGRLANDLAMGTVYEFVTKMLVALQMTLPWVQSYAFGRFANDLAMDTVIRIRDEFI